MVHDLVHLRIEVNLGANPDGNLDPVTLKNSKSKERTQAAPDQQGPKKAPTEAVHTPIGPDYDPKWVVHPGSPSCYF